MAGENPQPLTAKTVRAIQAYTDTISDTAAAITSATGVSVTSLGIATPIAREMNKDQLDYNQLFVPFRDKAVSTYWEMQPDGTSIRVPLTNDNLMQNYADTRDMTNSAGSIMGIANRLNNAALNDIGPGKFQVGTAIELLKSYINDPRFANDPLDLAKYDGHMDQMVQDLNSNGSPTAFDLTFKLSGLMNLQAVEWYTSSGILGQARWDQYSPDDQARMITTYYSVGRKPMIDAVTKEIAETGGYTPDLNTPGSRYAGSGNNMGVTKAALGENGEVVFLPDGTIEYFNSNGRIIREDSPATTTVNPLTGETTTTTTIKEFDQNNNVSKQIIRVSNADDSQSTTTQFAGSGDPIQQEIITVGLAGVRTDDVTTFGDNGARTGETITSTNAEGTSARTETRDGSGATVQVETNTFDSSTLAVRQVLQTWGVNGSELLKYYNSGTNSLTETDVVRNGDGSGQLTASNGTTINFSAGTLGDINDNGVMTISTPTTDGVPFISVDPETGIASLSGIYQAAAGSQINVSDEGIDVTTTRGDGTSQVTKLNQDGFQLEQSDYDAINNLIERNLKTYEGITFNETYENGTGTQVKATDQNGNVRTFNAGISGSRWALLSAPSSAAIRWKGGSRPPPWSG